MEFRILWRIVIHRTGSTGSTGESNPRGIAGCQRQYRRDETRRSTPVLCSGKVPGSGQAGDCTNEVTTIGDGIFRCIIREGDDVETHIAGDPANEKYSKTFGPGSNTNAKIKRTPEGAILTFSEPSLEGEGYCDFFGLFEGNNVPEDWPEVTTFTFTNDDLKSWPSLLKINDRTLNGPESGSLHVRATLHGGTLSYTESEVTINGCSELGVGEQVQVTAIGKPEGGRYRYWTEPSGMITIKSNGTSATLTGASPGRGTLFIEYTSPEGKTAQASQPATCSKIESYNGGQPIPQVAFYDFDGKRMKGINVPVAIHRQMALIFLNMFLLIQVS